MNASIVVVTEPRRARRVAQAIFAGGLIAGTIDIGAAAWINHLGVVVILHAIASGLLGRAAMQGGTGVALAGLLLQWGMSLLIAAIFVFAALKLAWLTKRPVLAGLCYGVIVFIVMNYVVMPLSAVGHVPHFSPTSLIENLAAMLLFGLIVAWATHRILIRKL